MSDYFYSTLENFCKELFDPNSNIVGIDTDGCMVLVIDEFNKINYKSAFIDDCASSDGKINNMFLKRKLLQLIDTLGEEYLFGGNYIDNTQFFNIEKLIKYCDITNTFRASYTSDILDNFAELPEPMFILSFIFNDYFDDSTEAAILIKPEKVKFLIEKFEEKYNENITKLKVAIIRAFNCFNQNLKNALDLFMEHEKLFNFSNEDKLLAEVTDA